MPVGRDQTVPVQRREHRIAEVDETQLNELGADGWRVAHVIPSSAEARSQLRLLLERVVGGDGSELPSSMVPHEPFRPRRGGPSASASPS